MRLNIRERTYWTDKVLPLTMEYGIYMLAIFFFTDKGESFRSFGLYLPAVALIIRGYLTRQWPFDWKNPLLLSIILLCVSAFISSLLSTEPLLFLNWIRTTYFKIFLIFIVITATFKKTEQLKRLIILLSLLSVFFTAMTFYDYVTKALTNNGEIIFDNVRKYNSILAYLLPFIPFALIATSKKSRKIFWILILCTGITALLLTGFRGGWVSFLVSMTLWGIWISFKRMGKPFILILGGVVTTAFIILTFLPSSHIAMKIQQGLSTTNRYEWIWKPYVQMYNELPMANKIIGSGMTKETMYKYHERYRQRIGNYPDENIPLNPHNNYLMILFKQGILGFILYINLIVIYVTSMIKTIRKRNLLEHKAMGIAILCPFVGEYIVHGLVEDLRFMPLGLLLGMAGAYLHMTNENKAEGLK